MRLILVSESQLTWIADIVDQSLFVAENRQYIVVRSRSEITARVYIQAS